ncbi:MAG TPA: crossover junction endodeoxyribonuclease RuvC [Candidatus Limnocylindrales bacterium]
MIVLGIDPGTAALGYGVVERTGGTLRAVDYGCIVTTPDLALPERLLHIHEALSELIETHGPDLVGVERLFFSKNAQTAFGVGQARGVVLLAAAQHAIPVREATPNEIKMGVTGFGGADKEQVGRMVAVILGLEAVPTPDDTADALACAISIANAERPGDRLNAGAAAKSAVVDRSAIAPITRGETPYERAVREAIARDAKPVASAKPAKPAKPARARKP